MRPNVYVPREPNRPIHPQLGIRHRVSWYAEVRHIGPWTHEIVITDGIHYKGPWYTFFGKANAAHKAGQLVKRYRRRENFRVG